MAAAAEAAAVARVAQKQAEAPLPGGQPQLTTVQPTTVDVSSAEQTRAQVRYSAATQSQPHSHSHSHSHTATATSQHSTAQHIHTAHHSAGVQMQPPSVAHASRLVFLHYTTGPLDLRPQTSHSTAQHSTAQHATAMPPHATPCRARRQLHHTTRVANAFYLYYRHRNHSSTQVVYSLAGGSDCCSCVNFSSQSTPR